MVKKYLKKVYFFIIQNNYFIGETDKKIYYLVKGLAELYMETSNNKETILLHTMQAVFF